VRDLLRCGLGQDSSLLHVSGSQLQEHLSHLKTDAASVLGSREATAERVPHARSPAAGGLRGDSGLCLVGVWAWHELQACGLGMQVYRKSSNRPSTTRMPSLDGFVPYILK
jgi:hypothetical protein